jgi:hypothetical protein
VTNGIRGALGVRSAVDDFTFKVNLVAVVRVRANDESIARNVNETSVIWSPYFSLAFTAATIPAVGSPQALPPASLTPVSETFNDVSDRHL